MKINQDPTPGQVAYEAMLDLQDQSMLCDCDTERKALCVACECLFSLVVAAGQYAFEWHWLSRGRTPPPLWTPEREVRHA